MSKTAHFTHTSQYDVIDDVILMQSTATEDIDFIVR